MTPLSHLDHLCVVLVAARNPLNIGAAARAMSNFGFSQLRVVNPYQIAFREARSAVGAEALLAQATEHSNVADAVADCTLVVGTTALQNRDLQHPLRRLEEGMALIRRRLAQRGRAAILFGSEKRGLSNEDLSHCHWLMRIPTREAHSSMNLGQAVAVCLFELIRSSPANELVRDRKTSQAAGSNPGCFPAASADLERLARVLLDSLLASGYIKPGAVRSTEEKLRRLVRRLNLTGEDATVLLGMFRKILRKLRD